jgi:hypothetical protein
MQWSISRPNLLHKKFDLNSLIIVDQVWMLICLRLYIDNEFIYKIEILWIWELFSLGRGKRDLLSTRGDDR